MDRYSDVQEDICSCGGKFERVYCTADLLFWKCSGCEEEEMESYAEMSDESWEWVKNHYRSTHSMAGQE